MAAYERAHDQARRLTEGVRSFASDMRDQDIHVGMSFGGSVLCVNCGKPWPCEGGRNV